MPPLASDARACTDRTPTSPTKTGSLQAAPFDCYPLILPLSRSLPQISQIQCSSRPVSTAAGVCVYAAEEVLQRYQISSSKLAVAILSNCTTLVAEQEVLGCEVHQKAQ
uniref:Uncharacterized protein n=1 Tax=Leersia perrieri TaxID=77586 RepID=A0A0D9WGB0_9ORYZ